jgi:RNA ligase (TIGR02306 family)
MTDRLATVERIKGVIHHPNADKLDIVKVLGYDAIVGRDQFHEDEMVVFVQPDSILPTDKEWATPFLKYTRNGRVRAARLRGEWSMGIVLQMPTADEVKYAEEGEDLTTFYGLTKFEPVLPGNTQAAGGLPFQMPKTDEERWQNLRRIPWGNTVDVTLKIDGQSFTAYVNEDKAGITSRSLDLKMGEGFNSNWHEAERKYNVLDKLKAYCQKNDIALALRGEVYGEGIQAFEGNPHAKLPRDVRFYSVYDIRRMRYLNFNAKHGLIDLCKELDLPMVPFLEAGVPLTPQLIEFYDNLRDTIQLPGEEPQPFEGVVVKGYEFSFKIINKHYDQRK